MKQLSALALVVSLLVPTTSQGQKAVSKTPPAKTPVAKFLCPDDKATVACNSFAENKEKVTENTFVCFREGVDQYFTVAIYLAANPSMWTWDAKTSSATSQNMVITWTTDHGIENDTKVPTGIFSGTWRSNAIGGYDFEEETVKASVGPSGLNLRTDL